jgi:hypothetical protein
MPGRVHGLDVNTLVRFLLTRLDDDVRETGKLLRSAHGREDVAEAVERRRADLEATRLVIGQLQQQIRLRDTPVEEPVRALAFTMLRTLAKPYAWHRGLPPGMGLARQAQDDTGVAGFDRRRFG